MSLEESIQLLSNEIIKLVSILKINNDLIRKKNVEPIIKIKKTLNEADAAKYIGMSRSFLSQDRMHGHRENRTKGPRAIKIGRKILYEIDELDAWLKKQIKI